MTWRFTLIKGSSEIEIDEPPGWDTINKTIKRDLDTHGIFFDFSQSSLQFVEAAYWIIFEEWTLKGVDADLGLRIEWTCIDCEECDAWSLFYSGKLDFQTYERVCGDDCYITVGLQASEVEVLIKNRLDIAVDLTSNVAYDGRTILPDYAWLNRDLQIPARALNLKSWANSTPLVDPLTQQVYESTYLLSNDYDFNHIQANNQQYGYILPKFNNITFSEILDFTPEYQLDYVADYLSRPILKIKDVGIPAPVNLYDIDLRFKGKIHVKFKNMGIGASVAEAEVILYKNFKYGNQLDALPRTELGRFTKAAGQGDNIYHEGDISFDFTYTGTIPLATNDRFWVMMPMSTFTRTGGGNNFFPIESMVMTWDDASYFQAENKSITFPTPAKTYFIHEAASRVVENITNNQFRFKSNYYGRTDSQPYSFPQDGCGGFRALTNGLQLRRAVLQDNTPPKVFLSLKDLYESLSAIDAVGMGVEGSNVVMEPIKYFYSDDVIFTCDGVDKITTKIRNDRFWNQFNFGYSAYETESSNGLDAIHTKREYRVLINNSNGKFEKYSKLIADPYSVEVTRRKFGTSVDWRYDQNIFILCLRRFNSRYEVNQGNIASAENLFDPQSIINYAITPVRNAMRWFAWLIQGIRWVSAEILFNSGTGNFVAKGRQGDGCVMEAGAITENNAINKLIFADPEAALPFSEPEKDVFSYPVGLNEFVAMSAKKYGKIQYRRFNTDPWRYGWIETIRYQPEEGQAEFTLIVCK